LPSYLFFYDYITFFKARQVKISEKFEKVVSEYIKKAKSTLTHRLNYAILMLEVKK